MQVNKQINTLAHSHTHIIYAWTGFYHSSPSAKPAQPTHTRQTHSTLLCSLFLSLAMQPIYSCDNFKLIFVLLNVNTSRLQLGLELLSYGCCDDLLCIALRASYIHLHFKPIGLFVSGNNLIGLCLCVGNDMLVTHHHKMVHTNKAKCV